MADEDPPLLEAPSERKPSRGTKRGRGGSKRGRGGSKRRRGGTKRGRGGSGVGASEGDLLAPEVNTDCSAEEDSRHPQVSSCWIFLPVASYSFTPAGLYR